MLRSLLFLLLLVIVGSGCASRPVPPPRAGEPIGLQILRIQPELKDNRFATLLDFEDQSDAVFVSVDPAAELSRASVAHTGQHALRLPEGTQRVTIKLEGLTSRPLPGSWRLAGVYMRSPRPLSVRVSLESDGSTISTPQNLPAEEWSPAFVDVGVLSVPGAVLPTSAARLVIVFDKPAGPEMFLDDLILVNNDRTWVDTADASAGQGWSLGQSGFRFIGNAPARFSFVLPHAAASPHGWLLEEANPLRARFASEGQSNALTVYVDGRAYWDGQYKPMSGGHRLQEAFHQQHQHPAELQIAQEQGRLVRTTPGDADNDGYNEQRGAYQILAAGARLEVRLVPQSAPLIRPILEIGGMPEGRLLASVEGHLVTGSVRTAEGNFLLELPLRIERPTTVNIRVR